MHFVHTRSHAMDAAETAFLRHLNEIFTDFRARPIELDVVFDDRTESAFEDLLIINPAQKIVGVIDGVSELYSPSSPQRLFGGKTGGQMVGQVIKRTLEDADLNTDLVDAICRANRNVAECQRQLGYPLDSPARMPGAAGGVLKFDFDEMTVDVVAWGDTLVVWQTRQDTYNGTRSETLEHDRHMCQFVESLMLTHRGNHGKMWDDFLPIVAPFRHERINRPMVDKSFALLNGQRSFEQMLYGMPIRLSLNELKQMAVHSDGLIVLDDTGLPDQTARHVLTGIAKWGLRGVLRQTRMKEAMQQHKSHTQCPEATAISLSWCNELAHRPRRQTA